MTVFIITVHPCHLYTGLLDQWLIEGKFTEEEALALSYDMLAAGIDTVSNVTQTDKKKLF